MSPEISRRRATQRPAPSSSSPRRRNRSFPPTKLLNPSNPQAHSYNVFSEILPILSPVRQSSLPYPEDSRVLISVSMEGSPGPIRTLMKLSSSVEEAIKLTIDECVKEGRIPPLETTASLYQLHLSSFSLESLDRSETIGSVRSRTFYLRKRAAVSEVNCADEDVMRTHLQPCRLMRFIPACVSRGIVVLLRRLCSMWKMIGCLHS